MKKISIVIPVYKVEAYIALCLESLLSQDLPPDEYEIICVNDGSPDDSAATIEKFRQNHPQVILISQENQGVSVARNRGIEAAAGEYIFFVDSDDTLEPNVLKRLYGMVKNNNLDLLYVHMEYFNEAGKSVGEFIMENPEPVILNGFRHQRRGFIFGLYRKEMLAGIRFIEGIPIGEDALFNIMVHTVAKRICYSSLPVYKYLIREGSALKSDLRFSEKAFNGYIKTIEVLKGYLEKNKPHFSLSEVNYFDRPFLKTIEITLDSNVIPTRSLSRLKKLKKVISRQNLDYLNPEIGKRVRYYDKNPLIFMAWQGLRKFIKGKK